MAKQTAAQRRAAEEQARLERQAEIERFAREQAPMLLLTMMARAQQLDVEYALRGPIENLVLSLTFPCENDGNRVVYRDERWEHKEELRLTSEQWEFDQVKNQLDRIVEERAEAARKLELARVTYDSLTPEQRDALGLKRRP